MTRLPLTPLEVMADLERLLRVHRRPAHAPVDAVEFAKDYVEVCGDVSLSQFRAAVTEYLRGPGRFFPKPGELRALALAQPSGPVGTAGTFDQWLKNGYRASPEGELSPCPACGQPWEWRPRAKLIHRHAAHRALRLPCVGACDEPRCIGAGVVPSASVVPSPPPASAAALLEQLAERKAIQSEAGPA